MTMKTMEQERAAFALAKVRPWATKSDEQQKQFRSYANSFPFMIRANGLGQAAAFYRSKGKSDPHYDLYEILSEWLCQSRFALFEKQTDLLDAITENDMQVYMAAQTEALLLMSWVQRFARAFLKSEE
ncbi:MAG: type III-B CRISPR module-associated protein Cmr5 [Deltaproteobacteria bacterium]|nr:MAG: type III-B CRISPR module-associated protein Cmr5 [Deltaproteobacteria bacterium]